MDSDFIKKFEEAMDGVEPNSVQAETVLAALPNWDSLAVLSVIALADGEYGAQVSGKEIHRCKTVEELRTLILSKKSA